jgi:hypothetical protein
MSIAGRVAIGLGCMAAYGLLLIGCASTKAAVEPPVETVTPEPVVEPVASPPTGPPPGYVAATNYWVREKIILGVAPEPLPSAIQKSAEKKGKKSKKAGKSAS